MIGNEDEPGIIVLTVREIFKQLQTCSDRLYLIRIGYIEIYNEKINDLFDEKTTNIKVYETQNGDVVVHQKEIIVNCEEDIYTNFDNGNKLKRKFTGQFNIWLTIHNVIF